MIEIIILKHIVQIKLITLLLLLGCIACNTETKNNSDSAEQETVNEIAFDPIQWNVKDGKDYPYREQMLNNTLYNESLRMLKKDEIIDLLGEPDRINEGHLYYTISQKRLGYWPLHTKSMVIKLSADNTIDWIKVHE